MCDMTCYERTLWWKRKAMVEGTSKEEESINVGSEQYTYLMSHSLNWTENRFSDLQGKQGIEDGP